jgi:hypothetical protein
MTHSGTWQTLLYLIMVVYCYLEFSGFSMYLVFRSERRNVCIKRENKLDAATQLFVELMNRSTCFGHYYVHHQELETMQLITACGT